MENIIIDPLMEYDISDGNDVYLLTEFKNETIAQFYDHRNDEYFDVDIVENHLEHILNYHRQEELVNNLFELPIRPYKN